MPIFLKIEHHALFFTSGIPIDQRTKITCNERKPTFGIYLKFKGGKSAFLFRWFSLVLLGNP